MTRRLVFALLLSACLPLAAHAADTQFLLMTGSDTVAVERVHESATQMRGRLRVAGRRMDYVLDVADAVPLRFELAVRSIGAPDSLPPLQHVVVAIAGDTARVIEGGAAVIPGARGAWPFANPSMALLARAIRGLRPGAGDSAGVRLLMPAIGGTMLATVRSIGADSVGVTLARVTIRFALDASGAVTGGSIPSQGVRIVVGPVAADEVLAADAKPDYSAPAGAPYSAEPVRVRTPGGFELAGTLTVPAHAAGPVPCVVTITGSGLEDRDEALPAVKGYRPFRQVADALARKGIATLRLDDRGFGESGGDPSKATSADLAGDTRAALAWLRARAGIDATRLALLGHSEGGLIAPMLAGEPGVRALVLMAGPSRTGRRVIEYQQRGLLSHAHVVDAAAEAARMRAAMARVDSSAATNPWLEYFVDYDPLPAARRVRVPVLVLQGATDHQVEPVQAGELGAALRAGGNRDVTVKVLPGFDHLFLPDSSGDPAGYPRLAQRDIPAPVLAMIADWLAARLITRPGASRK